MKSVTALLVAFACIASVAVAHEGVKNPEVMKRMKLMSGIKDNTAILGKMRKGAVPFDAEDASAARAALVEYAGRIPGHFEAKETDPKSEALPAIWTDWDDFVDKADAMQAAAKGLETDSVAAFEASFGAYAKSCRDCHEDYREE